MMQILGFENFSATFLKTLLGLGMGGWRLNGRSASVALMLPSVKK